MNFDMEKLQKIKVEDKTEEVIILPKEVQEIALQCGKDKQKEVALVLNQIFDGTTEWNRQVDAIIVKDVNDSLSISLAETARISAKKARLSAEKIIDAKRAEVQGRMIDDKLEDGLWLKAKQIMQMQLKAIEDKAERKANYVKIKEAEAKEKRTKERAETILNNGLLLSNYEDLSDDAFNLLISGLIKERDDEILRVKEEEAKKEAEAKAALEKFEEQKAENIRLKKVAEELEEKLQNERQVSIEIMAERAKEVEQKQTKPIEKEVVVGATINDFLSREEKLIYWIDGLSISIPDGVKECKTTKEIYDKFNKFKVWAKLQIENKQN